MITQAEDISGEKKKSESQEPSSLLGINYYTHFPELSARCGGISITILTRKPSQQLEEIETLILFPR